MENTFLRKYLEPIQPWLDADNVSEICVNRPGIVFVEEGKDNVRKYEVPELDRGCIESLAERVAASTDQAVNEKMPLLSAALPTGERIQFILPPAAPEGGGFSIRKQVLKDLSLDTYKSTGSFDNVKRRNTLTESKNSSRDETESQLKILLDENKIDEFMRQAVKAKKNIIISGGTYTGKTTFLNALTKEIPEKERLITLEDTLELDLPHENVFKLQVSKGDQGTAKVNIQQLLEATLRLRPDRILLGELRGAEAYTFLQAINTGHPGSISTVHADNTQSAFERLALMVMQANLGLKKAEIIEYLHSIIDVVIQWSFNKDVRYVSEIHYSGL